MPCEVSTASEQVVAWITAVRSEEVVCLTRNVAAPSPLFQGRIGDSHGTFRPSQPYGTRKGCQRLKFRTRNDEGVTNSKVKDLAAALPASFWSFGLFFVVHRLSALYTVGFHKTLYVPVTRCPSLFTPHTNHVLVHTLLVFSSFRRQTAVAGAGEGLRNVRNSAAPAAARILQDEDTCDEVLEHK